MAHILPDTPPQKIPKEVLRVFRTLKALPDTYYVWHHLAPWQVDVPDFLIINPHGKVLLVKVSSAADDQTNVAAQMLLLGDDKKSLGQKENALLYKFVKSLNLPDGQQVETLVIFPNIHDKQVQASRLERSASDSFWAGKEITQPDSNFDW